MQFARIKSKLADAGRLVDAGDVSQADRVIRSMQGHGLTPHDIADNLTRSQLRKLRAHARRAV